MKPSISASSFYRLGLAWLPVILLAASSVCFGAADDALPEVAGFPRMRIEQRTTKPLMASQEKWEEMCINWIGTVMKNKDGWQVWYEAYGLPYKSDFDSFLCYARSKDGVRWERPNLGLVEYAGNTNNNILIDRKRREGFGIHGTTVFLDERAPAEERYKMVFIGPTVKALYGGASADGIHWQILPEPIFKREPDTQNVCFRDGDIFRLYVRDWTKSGPGGRAVAYSESKTFGSFPASSVILGRDDKDPDGMDFYNSATAKLAENLYVMFPSGFYRDHTVRPHMAVSRDGKNFQRVGREPLLPLGADGAFDAKQIYVAPGAVPGEQPGTYWFYYNGYHKDHRGPWNKDGGLGRFLLVVDQKEASKSEAKK